MRASPFIVRVGSKSIRAVGLSLALAATVIAVAATAAESQTAYATGLLASRVELTAAATEAEVAATRGDNAHRAQFAMTAAAIRQRLRDGDLQVGDRIVVMYVSDAVHKDTVIVRSDRSIEISGSMIVPVTGVLRSELKERVSNEVLKYVKAEKIEVTPLMRVGVLGAVAHPGYFAFASDIPLTDAIMGAGGPTGGADVERSTVRRRSQPYRTAGETSKAIAGGLTLDQFGLAAGDELVVGERRGFSLTQAITLTGIVASTLAVVVALTSR